MVCQQAFANVLVAFLTTMTQIPCKYFSEKKNDFALISHIPHK
jgi:hypothetical protein